MLQIDGPGRVEEGPRGSVTLSRSVTVHGLSTTVYFVEILTCMTNMQSEHESECDELRSLLECIQVSARMGGGVMPWCVDVFLHAPMTFEWFWGILEMSWAFFGHYC